MEKVLFSLLLEESKGAQLCSQAGYQASNFPGIGEVNFLLL